MIPIPIELWKWGIENRSGRLRTFPEDIIKLNLMPSNKATITARGIKFNRASEKAKRRDYEGFELAKTETTIPETVMPSKNSDSKENKSLQPDHLELLRKKRQEHFNEHRE